MVNADGKVVQLHGAGATFPSKVYSRWIAAYHFSKNVSQLALVPLLLLLPSSSSSYSSS